MEKQINKALRKLAYQKALDGEMKYHSVTPDKLEELLGKQPFYRDIYQGNDYAGVVTGLAWTSVGGEILFIETSLSRGNGKLTLTGNLGDVMKRVPSSPSNTSRPMPMSSASTTASSSSGTYISTCPRVPHLRTDRRRASPSPRR